MFMAFSEVIQSKRAPFHFRKSGTPNPSLYNYLNGKSWVPNSIWAVNWEASSSGCRAEKVYRDTGFHISLLPTRFQKLGPKVPQAVDFPVR